MSVPRTRMEMPEHLEALISKPTLTRLNERKPMTPVVVMKCLEPEPQPSKLDLKRHKELQNIARKAREARERAKQVAIEAATQKNVYTHSRLILGFVENWTGISVQEIVGPSRKKPIVEARQITMWLMRRNCRGTYKHELAGLNFIGKRLGGRDHATILHGYRKIENTPELLAKAQQIEKAMLG